MWCLPHYLLNNSVSKGNSPSYSQNQQKLGKELMSIDELSVLDGSKCILQLRGVRPFFSDKFDITKHKRYKYLSDYDKKNAFDIEKFVSTKLKVNPNEDYDYMDCGELEDDMPEGAMTDFGEVEAAGADGAADGDGGDGADEDYEEFPEDLEVV